MPSWGVDWDIERDPSRLGLVLPHHLWFSGDATVVTDVPEVGPASAEVDALRLLARWDPLARLGFFTELRLEDPVEFTEGEGATAANAGFDIERLYGEALLTPSLSLRIGKVFTPFGLWNQINRAPLTWTVEEPAVTESLFPRRATGISLLYQTTTRGWTVDATLYGPAQDELLFARTHDPTDASGWLTGSRVAVGRSLGAAFTSLGASLAGFRPANAGDWAIAAGLDLDVAIAGHEVTSEFIVNAPTFGRRTRQGLYVQDAIPLRWNVFAVLRFEYFQPAHGSAAFGQTVGLFWRPVPNVVLKADYLLGTRTLENFEPGFHASFSFLF